MSKEIKLCDGIEFINGKLYFKGNLPTCQICNNPIESGDIIVLIDDKIKSPQLTDYVHESCKELK